MSRDPNRGANGRHGMNWIRQKKRAQIYARDGWLCVWCGNPGPLTLDHLVPRSLGGGNEATNLVTACRGCNEAQGNVPRAHPQALLPLPYVEKMGTKWV